MTTRKSTAFDAAPTPRLTIGHTRPTVNCGQSPTSTSVTRVLGRKHIRRQQPSVKLSTADCVPKPSLQQIVPDPLGAVWIANWSGHQMANS